MAELGPGATGKPSAAGAVARPSAGKRAPAAFGRPRFVAGAKAVGAFMPALTKPAFERYGFAAAQILADWPAIVGPALARFTEPERLKWPRRAEEEDEGPPAASPTSTSRSAAAGAPPPRKSAPPRKSVAPRGEGATLVLRVDGPASIEIQHRAPQILERINTHFGYRAVTALRIVQAPVVRQDPFAPTRPRPQPAARPVADVSGIEDERLRTALDRLGRFVAAKPGG
ncbi:MAG: DciA family protein [Hyphomicrobiaceae bacterium]